MRRLSTQYILVPNLQVVVSAVCMSLQAEGGDVEADLPAATHADPPDTVPAHSATRCSTVWFLLINSTVFVVQQYGIC